jgi:hypothetical protein
MKLSKVLAQIIIGKMIESYNLMWEIPQVNVYNSIE